MNIERIAQKIAQIHAGTPVIDAIAAASLPQEVLSEMKYSFLIASSAFKEH
jgi:hypothetical protein